MNLTQVFGNIFPGEPHHGGKLGLPTVSQEEQTAFLPQRLLAH